MQDQIVVRDAGLQRGDIVSVTSLLSANDDASVDIGSTDLGPAEFFAYAAARSSDDHRFPLAEALGDQICLTRSCSALSSEVDVASDRA